MLAEADPLAAEFAPIYTEGRARGMTRSELRSMPVSLVAVSLGIGDDPPAGPAALRRRGRPRPPRPRKRVETGKVFRGKDAR